MTDSGIYLHIPFCRRKCAYCDFYSLTMPEALIDNYLSALKEDIRQRGGRTDRPFDTVYIGGGTPSVLGEKIADLLETVTSAFNLRPDAEITVEVNPDVSDSFLRAARTAGANRISVGIQSGIDRELAFLGRTHTAGQAQNAVERIRNAGFENISADLMICLPGSDLETLSESLEFFLRLELKHISAYMLKVEEKTKFGKLRPSLPDEEDQARQYLYICEALRDRGYTHYEISNFALSGFESRHNLKYWSLGEYLGFGPSAHSFFEGKRFYYPRDINKYMNERNTVFDGFGGDNGEKIMLGARLKKGIDLSDHLCDNIDVADRRLNRLAEAGLIEKNGFHISLTDRGMLVSNAVITELLELTE